MAPLTPEGMDRALEWLEPYPLLGRVSLRHALRERRPGLWGDDPARPLSVLWSREAEGKREVFAAGEPAPALAWLAEHQGPLHLIAPENWVWEVEEAFIEVERAAVLTRRYRPGDLGVDGLPGAWAGRPAGAATARPLTVADRGSFLASAPPWALRGWPRFEALMAGGAAFGVEVGSGFGALAWVDATDGRYETVGLFATPKYRQLGLGRAAARALIRHILIDRRRQPLWASSVENVPSNGLACSLGMVASISEPLLRCTFEPAAS